MIKRCAAVLEFDQATKQDIWRIIHHPTIGDIRNLRQKGAIIMRQVVERHGNEIHKWWVNDSDTPIVYSMDIIKGAS